MSYISKYTGAEIETILDIVSHGLVEILNTPV